MDVSVVTALEDALTASSHLLPVRYAPTIAAARQLAVRMDKLAAQGWTDEAGKLDNVTVPTFLRYMDALGLTVPKAVARPGKSEPAEPEPDPAGVRAAGGATISSLQDRAAKRLSGARK